MILMFTLFKMPKPDPIGAAKGIIAEQSFLIFLPSKDHHCSRHHYLKPSFC